MAEKVEIVELPTSPPPRSQSETQFPSASAISSSAAGIVTSPPVIEGIVELPGESLLPGSATTAVPGGGAAGINILESGTGKEKESCLHQVLLQKHQQQQQLLLASLGQQLQQTVTNQSQLSTASSTTTTTTRKVIRSISSSSSSTSQQHQLQSQQQVSTSSSCSSLLASSNNNGTKKVVTFYGQQEQHQQQQQLQTFSTAQRSLASMSSPCISAIMADVKEEEEGASEESLMLAGGAKMTKIGGNDSGGTAGAVGVEDESQKRMRIMAENLSMLSTSVASVAHHESVKEAMKASTSTSSTLQTAEGANVATSSSSSVWAAHQRRRLMTSRQQKQHQSMIVLSRTTKQSRSHKFFRLIDIFLYQCLHQCMIHKFLIIWIWKNELGICQFHA